MNNEVILITGGTGFIGSNLVKKMQRDGYSLLLLTHNKHIESAGSGVEEWQYTGNIDELKKLFQTKKIKGIIHLATCFAPAHTYEQIPRMINSNIELGTLLLDCAYNAGVSFFLNIGTFWQHYNADEYNPVNLYAATKQALEDIAAYYRIISDVKICTLCLNDTYGRGDTRKKIFPLWKELAADPQRTMEMSAGEQIIDILHIDDVVAGIIHLMKMMLDNAPQISGDYIFYLSATDKYTLRETAEIFEKVCGNKLNIKWGIKPYRLREVMLPACYGKLLPGWKSRISLVDGIKDFLGIKENE